jgi:hypothetical protein
MSDEQTVVTEDERREKARDLALNVRVAVEEQNQAARDHMRAADILDRANAKVRDEIKALEAYARSPR